MNNRLEMKTDSTSSDLKDKGQAMNGHLPAYPNTKMYTKTPVGTQVHTLSPQIYCTVHHKAMQLAVSVVTTLKVI